jgi:PAS domain S-box-containing protein
METAANAPPTAPSGALTALTQAPLGIAIFDRDMRYLAASRRYLIDQGLSGDTPLLGRVHYDVFPEVPDKWREVHAQALTHGIELSHEADPYQRADGVTVWVRWSVAPWREDSGQIGGLVLYTEDVTPQVEARLRLEAAEARYRAVFDQAASGVARVSPTGRFLEVNDRFCAITHYSRAQLLARTFQDITHPEDLEKDIGEVRRVLDGDIDTYTLEKRYLGPDGEIIWIDLTVSLVCKPDGTPDYFVSIIEDIAARKQAQTEQQRFQSQQRLLINELNHRVKNTLATVQSMAAQTLRTEPNPVQAYGKFEARLMGLAEVHDVLTRESWHGADLKEVAERAMRPFAGASDRMIRIEGPQVWLAPGAALTLALVFHELATNAVKYGALSQHGGEVALAWTFDPGEARLKLTWAEFNGPPVRPPTRKGFGSRLIERGFRGELRGRALMDYDPRGLVCVMEARLPLPTETSLSLHESPLEPGPGSA